MARIKNTARKGTGGRYREQLATKAARATPLMPPNISNSILHQIPCWVELCELLSQMSDTEITDLVSIASDQGTTIVWADHSVDIDACAFVGMSDPSTSHSDEPFSIALKHLHQNKLAGQHVEYNNDYLNLAVQMDERIKTWQVKQKQFAHVIQQAINGLLADGICNLIAGFCNEDRLDHYDCRKVFDDSPRAPFNPIGRLAENFDKPTELFWTNDQDGAASVFKMPLFCKGIYGKGQRFGTDTCEWNGKSILVFGPKEMKAFATRMIKRLMKVEDANIKQIIFGVNYNSNQKKRKMNSEEMKETYDMEPPLKKRKLNNTNTKYVDDENENDAMVIGHDMVYQVSSALSGSAIFEPTKQDIVWKHIFMLNEEQISKVVATAHGNHCLSVLCFGLNAAAMNRGVIVHYRDNNSNDGNTTNHN
eukprot:618170_1